MLASSLPSMRRTSPGSSSSGSRFSKQAATATVLSGAPSKRNGNESDSGRPAGERIHSASYCNSIGQRAGVGVEQRAPALALAQARSRGALRQPRLLAGRLQNLAELRLLGRHAGGKGANRVEIVEVN